MKKLLILLLLPALSWAGTIYTIQGVSISPDHTDSFTGTDGTLLNAHDSNWVTAVHPYADVAQCEIRSNQLRANGIWGLCSTMFTTSSSDSSQAVLKPHTDLGVEKGVCVRMGVDAGSDKTGYCAMFCDVGGSGYEAVCVQKAGVYLDARNYTVAPWDIALEHTIKIKATGSGPVSLELFVDGVSQGSATDSGGGYGTGHPGLTVNGNGDAAVTGIDDWTDAP